MTADLALVPAVADDDDELDELEHAVEIGLTAAVASLTRLRQLDAHRRRGYPLWHSYVLARFGELLRLLRLPDGERLALVSSMCTPTAEHRRGVPVREQAQVLGVAVGSIQNDRRALGLVAPSGPRRPAPEPLPAPAGHVWEQTVEWLRRAGDRGLTLVELAKLAHWTEGKASGALSDVCRRGLAVRVEDRRAGQRVHMLTEAGAALDTVTA